MSVRPNESERIQQLIDMSADEHLAAAARLLVVAATAPNESAALMRSQIHATIAAAKAAAWPGR